MNVIRKVVRARRYGQLIVDLDQVAHGSKEPRPLLEAGAPLMRAALNTMGAAAKSNVAEPPDLEAPPFPGEAHKPHKGNPKADPALLEPADSMPDMASPADFLERPGEVDLTLLATEIQDVLSKSSAIVLPTARSLQVALAAAEVIHVIQEVFNAIWKLGFACMYIYLAYISPATCEEHMIPACLRRMAICLIATALAGIVLILPEGRLMEAMFHCAMIARHRAAGKHDLADREARLCVGKVVFAARLATVGTVVYAIGEFLHLIFWLTGWLYAFGATDDCSGPVWFNWLGLRPSLPTFFSMSVVVALVLRSSRQKFVALAQSTATGDTNALKQAVASTFGESVASTFVEGGPDVDMPESMPDSPRARAVSW